jgi:hypothetical protein
VNPRFPRVMISDEKSWVPTPPTELGPAT